MSGQPASYDMQHISISYPDRNKLFNEAYGFSGSQGLINLEGVLLKPENKPSKTVLFFMHPATPMDVLPLPRALAGMGFHVLCGRNRYYKTDHVLIFEKVLLDFGEWLRYAKEELGYEKVILYGWSGGGSLAVFYQSEAENPTITETPAGDPVDIRGAGLIAADAVVFQAAPVSRARSLTEGIDPSVRNEQDPEDRELRLDMYSPNNPNQPPYSADFIAEYRAAQLARMRKITSRVKETLEVLQKRGGMEMERGFVTHRTMADLRYWDKSIDPNDRRPRWSFTGEPETANSGPVGLARFSSLRSWLSQWSIDDSRADASACAKRLTVPFLAIENGGDDGAPAPHVKEVYANCSSPDKTYKLIPGANHYYANQPELLKEASDTAIKFMSDRGLIDSDVKT